MNFSMKQALKVVVVLACAIAAVATTILMTKNNNESSNTKSDELMSLANYNKNIGIISDDNLSKNKYNGMTMYDSIFKTLHDGTNLDLGIGRIENVKPNSYYTLSFWVRGFEDTAIVSYFYPSATEEGYSSEGKTTNYGDGRIYHNISTSWQKMTITYKTKSDVSGTKNFISARTFVDGPRIQVAGVKFEEGKTASAYIN